MADRTESIVLEFDVDLEDSIESIESLTKANKELREERKKLNLDTADGQKRVQEINAQLDKNTQKIVANSSAVEKQRANIGNYKSALDGVHPALGKVGQGLEAGATGFKAMARSALAFIATPIGAILAALVAVFTLLKTAISTNNEVLDKFENITTAVGQVMTIIINRVGKLGEALIALVSGNFSEAIDLTGQAFGGLADEIGRAVAEGQVLLDMSRDLEDAQRQLRIEQAKQENVIKALVVAAKNRNLSLDEQEGKLREALKLEQNLVATREQLAAKELEIAVRQLANDENIQKSSEETFQQFAERLIKNGQLGDDQVEGLIENIEKLEQARGSSLAFQEKVENSLAAIQEKRAVALEKQNEALKEQAALREADRRANAEEVRSSNDGVERVDREDPLIGAFQTQLDNRLQVQKNFDDRIAKQQKDAANEAIRNAKRSAEAQAEIEKNLQETKLNTIAGFLGVASSLFDQESEEYKAFATFQTLISTYSTAQKAYEAAFVPPTVASPALGALNVALAIATGLANLAAINGVQFAEGGVVLKGKSHAQGGIPIEAEGNEIILTKGVYQNPRLRQMASDINVAGGGRRFADGGLVSNTITAPINQSMELLNIVKNLPPQVVSVKEVSTVQRRVRVKESLSKR